MKGYIRDLTPSFLLYALLQSVQKGCYSEAKPQALGAHTLHGENFQFIPVPESRILQVLYMLCQSSLEAERCKRLILALRTFGFGNWDEDLWMLSRRRFGLRCMAHVLDHAFIMLCFR